MRGTIVRFAAVACSCLWIACAFGCAGGGDDDDDNGGAWSGALPPGAAGSETRPLPVQPSTWYRLTADASASLQTLIYLAEPLDGTNLVVQCTAPHCVVDFVTAPDAATVFVQLQNFSTVELTWNATVEVREIPAVSEGAGPTSAALTGKESAYYQFVAGAALYEFLVDVGDEVSTPVSVKLYDEASVVRDSSFVTFNYTNDPLNPARIEEQLTAGTYYLKVLNLPDPFEVDDALTVTYTIEANAL